MSFANYLNTSESIEKVAAEHQVELEKTAQEQYERGFQSALELDKSGELELQKCSAALVAAVLLGEE